MNYDHTIQKHYKAYIANQRKNHKKIDHSYILQHCEGVDQDYIHQYKDIKFNHIIKHYPIREEYLELLINEGVIRTYNSYKQKLSIDFYKKYKDEIDLYFFIAYQKLSEKDIKEIFDDIIDKKHLDFLFKYQILSESFLRSMKEYWIKDEHLKEYIGNYNKLSDEFIKEFELDKHLSESNWLYKSVEYKKERVIETKKYECFDDYFIAYKAIRKNRYSIYNFQYKYMEDGTYEAKANYNINFKGSFGLSIGIIDHCKDYCKDYGGEDIDDYIIVKCKIYYDDIAAIVDKGVKIRCTKIQILD